MNDTKIAELSVLCKDMGFEAPESFIGNWMLKNKITDEHLDSVVSFMTNSTSYKHERVVDNLIKKSRLPQVAQSYSLTSRLVIFLKAHRLPSRCWSH